jgi:PAS domain S-box-containing protein
MSFELPHLLFAGLGYLLLLFAIAHLAERGIIPDRLLRHPLVYTLSIGVFATAYAVYGVIGLAHDYGYGYLAYYVGIAGTFVFAPLLLAPVLRICRTYQLSSLADLVTFRFRSQWVGTAVTLFTLMAMLPLLALQIQAVADSIRILTAGPSQAFAEGRQQDNLALLFCCVITIFTILFGSKHRSSHQRHNGLVAAIAFESLFKVCALLILGGIALFGVFDGWSGLDNWLVANPERLDALRAPIREDSARSLMLIFFAIAICMPQLFHMVFAENPSPKALQTASWGISIYLILLSLPILPILWAGIELNSYLPPEYFALALGIERDAPLVTLLVYLAGLSAASGTIIVTTLALASMFLNHLILPFYQPGTHQDIYRWLLWTRRLLMVGIILVSYVFYRTLIGREELADLGMAAGVATLQLLPGVLAVLYWPRANRIGLLAGLAAGFLIWFFALLLPIISDFDVEPLLSWLNASSENPWAPTALIALAINTLVFALVSALTPTSPEERAAAEVCSLDDLNRPARRSLDVHSIAQVTARLATVLGAASAEREVNRALEEMNIDRSERRPFVLRRLRDLLESNLSGLMGPSVAHEIINRLLPYGEAGDDTTEDITLIEVRLERYRSHLTGLAADLDALRRHHRQTLQELPIGLCSLGKDGEVLMWNDAMEALTGISVRNTIGSDLSSLPAPWSELLRSFFESSELHRYKQRVDSGGRTRWLNLHKARNTTASAIHDGQVITVEDITELQLLEEELVHSERLASIGRLAAGVAHEIGNPVTGIACLAQNLKYDTDNPESLLTANEIVKQTQRISRIVQTLVNFAHAGSHSNTRTPGEVVALADCVGEAIALLQLNKEARPVRFENLCPPTLLTTGNSQRLLQVFVNLLSNARDASEEHAPITVTAAPEPGGRLHVQITDRGSGIAAEHQAKVFEPFFTTKEPGKGTGLGLAMVYSIIEELGGDIEIESPVPEQGCGTRIHLYLPAAAG